MYYGKPTYNINANDRYKGWTYFHDNAFHSDLRDYIFDTTRSNRRMHAWRLSRFISRFHDDIEPPEMTKCDTCGETEFELVAGLFYCVNCQTQSQVLRQEEVEDHGVLQFNERSLLIQPSKSKEKKTDVENLKSKNIDYGRPWKTHEAFTAILSKQVDALILMGASSLLKDVVLRLWIKWLNKLEVAFCDEINTTDNMNAYERDLFPGTLKKPAPFYAKTKISKLENHGDQGHPSLVKIDQWIKQHQSEENIETQSDDLDFYDGDNPLEDLEPEELNEREYVLKAWKALSEKKDKPAKTVEIKNETYGLCGMQMNLTLVLCFLGLKYTNNLVTAADFRRMVHQGKVPYGQVDSLLPSDMKFFANDHRVFNHPSVPSSYFIQEKAVAFQRYLEIPAPPIGRINSFVCKMILQLNLPVEMIGMIIDTVTVLIEKPVAPKIKEANIPYHCHVDAASRIIFFIKLLFGLDDCKERGLSKLASQLIPNVPEVASSPFNYNAWVSYIDSTYRIDYSQSPHNISKGLNRKSEASCHASEMCHGVHNVDSFLQRWQDNIQPRRTVNPLKEDTETKQISKNILHRLYSTLERNVNQNSEQDNAVDMADHGLLMSTLDNTAHAQTPSAEVGDVPISTTSDQSTSFKSTSLQYIFSDSAYTKNRKKVSTHLNKTVDDNTHHRMDCESDSELNAHVHPSSMVDNVQEQSHQQNSSRVHSEESRVLSDEIRPSTSCRSLGKHQYLVYSNCLPSVRVTLWHRSYHWILIVFAALLECQPILIDSYIRKIEEQFFGGGVHHPLPKKKIKRKKKIPSKAGNPSTTRRKTNAKRKRV